MALKRMNPETTARQSFKESLKQSRGSLADPDDMDIKYSTRPNQGGIHINIRDINASEEPESMRLDRVVWKPRCSMRGIRETSTMVEFDW